MVHKSVILVKVFDFFSTEINKSEKPLLLLRKKYILFKIRNGRFTRVN